MSTLLETKESLAYRIDFAWSIYQGKDVFDDALRHKAMAFMIEAFNLQNADHSKIPLLLAYLMQKRENMGINDKARAKSTMTSVAAQGFFKASTNDEFDKGFEPCDGLGAFKSAPDSN